MSESKVKTMSPEETNQKLSRNFKDYGARESSSITSEEELANLEIQEQFYGKSDDENLLPFHVDINNPPFKK